MEQIEIPDFDEDGDASFDFGAPSNGFNWGGNSWKAPRPPFAQSHTADFTTGSSGSPYASVNNTSNSSLASSHFGSSHSRNRSFASQKLHQGTSQEAISLNGQLSNVSSSSNLTFQLGGQAAPAEQQSLSAASGHSNTYDTSSPYYTALLLVLDQFLSSAESKISDILGRPVDQSIYLPSILGQGVDPAFDRLLASLAKISKKMSKTVVNHIMRWRKDQSQAIDTSRSLGSNTSEMSGYRHTAEILTERKYLSSIYVLCRVLTAVVESATRETLGDDVGSTLEDIIYNSLKNADPSVVERSQNRKANSDRYARLIGALSSIRFLSLTDRFLSDLKQIINGTVAKESEARLEQIIRGMRYIKLVVYPMEAFEEAAEFVEGLANVFDAASGARIKSALAQTLTQIFEPVIMSASAEVNHPIWARAMQVIYSRASNMMSKPRYQSVALPLICASSAASPEEALLANFSTCIEACITRLKEKSTRNVAFYGICQLLYAYLRRCHETHTGVSKRLDPIIRTIFPSSRKQLYPPDVSPDRIAVIPHLIFQHHYEYGNELVAGLLNPTPSISNDNWPPETLCFERMHCAIRALMYTLDVSESGRDLVMDSPPQELDSFGPPPPLPTVSVENLSEMFLSRGPYRQLVESSSATIAKIAMACNIACDNFRLLDDRNILQREGPAFYPQTPERDASHVQKRHGGFMVTYPREKQPLFDLLRICFDSWPRLLAKPHTVAEFKPAEILIQNLLHIDLSVYHSARKALERLTKQPDGHTYLCALTRSVAKPDLVLRETSSLQGANTVKLESLVGLWSELVEGFCQQLEQVASTQPRPMPGFGAGARRPNAPSAIDEHATAVLDGVNPQQLTYILPELEGTAMVLSVSSSNLIRRRASDVLRLIVKIHSALSAWSMAVSGSPLTEDEPRVLTTLGDSASHLLSEIEVDLVSSTEKTRLNHWKEQCTSSGQAPTDAILQIIAGNHSVDHSIWHHLLPRVFNHLADACPIFISIARPLFVVRHLAVYPTAAAVAGLMTSKATVAPSTMRNGTQYSPATSDTRFLADHWKTHLVVLCATMPAQNTQTVTPAPVDGAQIDPDRLKTGPEIVKLAVPFLASDESLLRDASVIGLGCMSADAYRSLLEGLSHIILHLVQEHQRRAGDRSAMRRSARNARLHLSVASVQEVASKLLRAHQASDAEVGLLSHYIRETLPIVRETDPNEAALRRAFSICTMNIIDYCGSRGQLKRWFASDIRQQLFALFRTWSFLPLASQSPELRQHKRGESGVSQVHSSKNRSGGSGSLPVHDVFMPSVKAIAALCEHNGLSIRRDPADKASVEPQEPLRWAQELLTAPSPAGHECARQAIGGLIACNLDNRAFLDATVFQCFSEPDHLTLLSSTFSVLSGAVIAEPSIAVKSSSAMSLALWKLGNADILTRQRALDMVMTMIPTDLRDELMNDSQSAVHCIFSGAILQARQRLTRHVARHNVVDPRQVFLELAIRMLQVAAKQTRLLMQLLPCWLEQITLPPPSEPNGTDTVLANIFLLHSKYCDHYQLELRALWSSIAKNNLPSVLRFLVNDTAVRGSKDFTKLSQRILGSLCEPETSAQVLAYLTDIVLPSAVTPNLEARNHLASRRTNLDSLYPVNPRRMPLASAQSAILLSGDALLARLHTADPNVIRFLHVLILHSDQQQAFIRTQSRDILTRCLNFLNKLDRLQTSVDATQLAGPAEVSWDWRSFWEHEEDSSSPATRRTTINMEKLIEDALRLLSKRIPDVRRLWGMVAHEWAVSCTNRHMACRSFQVFRLLMPEIDARMLSEILSRLSNTISSLDSAPDRIFAREILHTLITIGEVKRTSLYNLPQLWWSFVACGSTTNEEELIAGLLLGQTVLDRFADDEHAGASVDCVKPQGWESSYSSISSYLIKSVRSSRAIGPCWDFVQRLLRLSQADDVTDSSSSLHLIYAFTLQWGLEGMETGDFPPHFDAHCDQVAQLAEELQEDGIARVSRSLGKNRFRTKEDFVRQAISNMKEYFSVQDQLDTYVLYLGSLRNPLQWVPERTLVLLKSFTHQLQLLKADVDRLGVDILAPLTELLNGDMAASALDVLDAPLPQGGEVLSRQRSGSLGSTRGGLSAVSSRGMDTPVKMLFGRASMTGWSIGEPAEEADATRRRFREVAETCGGGAHAADSRASSPFAFAPEESMQDVAVETASQSEKGDLSTLGEMVSTLYDLGSFFDENSPSSPAIRMSQNVSSAPRVAAVLARSLRSQGSNGSIQSSKRMSLSMSTIPELTPSPFCDDFTGSGRTDNGPSDDMEDPLSALADEEPHPLWDSPSEKDLDTDVSSLHSLSQDNLAQKRRRSGVFNWAWKQSPQSLQ